ncbi:MAG: transposase, partial [Acidobacteria bacterium]|nr:transposase [Acidobacteriota bacterium]
MAASHRSGASAAVFTDFAYAARSWQGLAQRVVAKAEVVRLDDRAPRPNLRFVVTNLRHRADRVYAIYCGQGEIGNRIMELEHDLALDRTSCQAFAAN